jgi:hypothetical protein
LCVFALARLKITDYPLWFLPAMAALLATYCLGLTHVSQRRPGLLVPFVLGASLYAAAVVCVHAQTARVMEAGMLGAVVVLTIAGLASVRGIDAGTIAPPASLLLVGTSFIGYHETSSSVPMAAFLLPVLAPLAALLPLWRMLIGLIVMIILAVAIGLAMTHAPIDFADLENL